MRSSGLKPLRLPLWACLVLWACLLLPALPSAAWPAPKVFTSPAPAPPPRFVPAGQSPQVVAGPPGPAGQSGAGVGLSVKAPPAGMTPAVGDGVADDTAPIKALVAYCALRGVGRVYLPSGVYNISSPIVLCNPSPTLTYTAVALVGDGPGANGLTTQLGTTIQMTAAGQDCVVQVDAGSAAHPGQLLNGLVQDVFLSGHYTGHGATVVLDTPYGVHFTGTGFNSWTCERVSATNITRCAVQVDAAPDPASPGGNTLSLGTSRNGENGVLDHCRADNCGLFCRTAGQAYGWAIRDCQCVIVRTASGGLPPVQTMIKDGYAANGSYGGFGLVVSNFSGSFGFDSANNVAFDIGGSAENTEFDRCRVEHCGYFLWLEGSGVAFNNHVSVHDCTFTDLIAGGGNLLHRASNLAQTFCRITDCNFQSADYGTPAAYTKACVWPAQGGDEGHYVVDGCTWQGYDPAHVVLGASPPGATPAYPAAGTVLRDDTCVTGSATLQQPQVALTN